MREFIDNEGERHIDPFCFDEFGMIDRGIKAIRFLYGVTGVVGLIGGAALLIWPVKTLVVLAVILGAYFIIASVVRIGVAVGTPFMPAGWRALNILSSLLLLFCGIIMLKNQTASAAALATLAAIAIGFGWIIEGVVTPRRDGHGAQPRSLHSLRRIVDCRGHHRVHVPARIGRPDDCLLWHRARGAGRRVARPRVHLWKDLTLAAFATRPVCASTAIQHRYSPPGPPQKAWAVLSI